MPTSSYSIRPATGADAAIVAHHRAAMFLDMGEVDRGQTEELRRNSIPWLATQFAAGSYRGWLAEHAGDVVAGAGLLLRDSGPNCLHLHVGTWGHVVNVYTEPAHRRRGLARRLMEELLGWCRANRLDDLTLSASDEGRPLYEALGFRPTNEMRLPMRRT